MVNCACELPFGGPLGSFGVRGGTGGPGGDRVCPREVLEGSWGAVGKGHVLFVGE